MASESVVATASEKAVFNRWSSLISYLNIQNFLLACCKTKIDELICNLTCCLLLLDIDMRLNMQMGFRCVPPTGLLILSRAVSWQRWH